MTRPNFEAATRIANDTEGRYGPHHPTAIVSRAYLSLLEAVEPLLEAVDLVLADSYEIDIDAHYHRDELAERASALRDLLGPTGGDA